jgi:hypothetical protein
VAARWGQSVGKGIVLRELSSRRGFHDQVVVTSIVKGRIPGIFLAPASRSISLVEILLFEMIILTLENKHNTIWMFHSKYFSGSFET